MNESERNQLDKVRQRIEEVADDLAQVKDRVEHVETEQVIVKNIPGAVAEKIGELKGAVDTLTELVSTRADRTDGKVEQATSFKNALQFAGVVLVPLLVALIGALVVIHSGAPAH